MEQTHLTKDFIDTVDNLLKTGKLKNQKVVAKTLRWSESGLSAVMARKRNIPFEYAYNLYKYLKAENLTEEFPQLAQHYNSTPDPDDLTHGSNYPWKDRDRELEVRLMKLEAAIEVHEAYLGIIRKSLPKDQQRQIDHLLRNRAVDRHKRMMKNMINDLNREIIRKKFDPRLMVLHSAKVMEGEIQFNRETGLFVYKELPIEEVIRQGKAKAGIVQKEPEQIDRLHYKEIIPGENYMIDPRYPLNWVPPFLMAEKDDRWVVAFGYRVPDELKEQYENKEWHFFYESSEKWSAKNGNLPDKLKGTDHKSVIAYILQWLQEGGNPFEIELLRNKALAKIDELRQEAELYNAKPPNIIGDSGDKILFTLSDLPDTKPDTEGKKEDPRPPNAAGNNIELE